MRIGLHERNLDTLEHDLDRVRSRTCPCAGRRIELLGRRRRVGRGGQRDRLVRGKRQRDVGMGRPPRPVRAHARCLAEPRRQQRLHCVLVYPRRRYRTGLVRLVVWGWFDERERSAAACLRFRRHVPGRPDDSRRGGSDDDRVAFGLGRFGTRRDHHRPAGPGRRGDFDELLGPNHRGVRRGRGELELGGRHERRQRFVPGTRVLGRRKLHGEPKRDRCGGRPICSVDGSPGRPGPRPPDDRGEPVRSGAWSTRPIHGFGAGRDRPVHVFLGVRRRGNWWESLDNLAYLHDERAVRHDRHRPRRSRRGHVGLVEPIDCPQRYGCRELDRRRGPARCGV